MLSELASRTPIAIQHATRIPDLTKQALSVAPSGIHQGLLYASPAGSEVPILGNGSSEYTRLFNGSTGNSNVLDLGNRDAANSLADMVEDGYKNLDVSRFNNATTDYTPDGVRDMGITHANDIRNGITEGLSDNFGVLNKILKNKNIDWLKGKSGVGEDELVAVNNDAVQSAFNQHITKAIKQSGADKYLGKPNILNNEDGFMESYNGSRRLDTNGIKRIGSSEVAPVREETLPDGWKQLEKYLDNSNDRLPIALGKLRSKITKEDLKSFLDKEGYYDESLKTKDQLWRQALQMIDDQAIDEIYEAGGGRAASFLETRLPFRGNPGLTDATNYYIGAKGRTGRLDAEYSDRLGIGRSNTPMSDRLVDTRSGANGDYSYGAFGTDPTWATGEDGVSTSAHERMHAWQDIDKFQYDEGVENAIDELRNELKKFYHDEAQIRKYWGNSSTDYYMKDIEQEARMLQSYLDNEGFTNSYRKTSRGTEWGDEIKPVFDKFYKKFRALSKAGVALPAIALLFGLSANGGDRRKKNLDNI